MVNWVAHSKIQERHYDGTAALDLDDTVGGTTINLGIVTESTINPDTNSLYSGLTAVATATGWTGPVALANLSCALDGSNDLVFDADDPTQIAQDASGFSNGRSVVLYRSDDSHILASYTHPQAFGNVNGPINISFDANGILKVTI
ncbi:MAG: hypothetical protein ABJM39_09660 [Porticoccus sp.]|uniref:hypothetical protein n=1 Tax=Porticoccus sp. TaxID=2024853 RepID=UPI003299534A